MILHPDRPEQQRGIPALVGPQALRHTAVGAGQIRARDRFGGALERHLAALQPDPGRTQRVDGSHVVADEQDGGAAERQIPHGSEAAALKYRLANRKYLIDDENVGLQVRRHSEREPHVHPGRIPLHCVSMNRSTPENATVSSNFRPISRRVIPRIAPLR